MHHSIATVPIARPANTASNAGTAFNPVQYGSLQGQVYR